MNTTLFNFIWGLSHKSGLLDAVGVLLAQYLPYPMGLGALFFVLTFKGSGLFRLVIFAEALLAVILSRGIIAESIRFFYHHPRPFVTLGFDPLITVPGYSFPSEHASAFFALAAVLYFFSRGWGVSYYILAFINGVARIYVGVHWPFDILGGAVVGVIAACAVHLLLKPYREGVFEKRKGPISS
jgi:undecaprenyl-diphosphatase